MAGLGELKSPWHDSQMSWLESHLHIINTYSQALENLENKKGEADISSSRQNYSKEKYLFEVYETGPCL